MATKAELEEALAEAEHKLELAEKRADRAKAKAADLAESAPESDDPLDQIEALADAMLPDAGTLLEPQLTSIKSAVGRARDAKSVEQHLIRPEGE